MYRKTLPALALALSLLTAPSWAQKTQPAPLRIMPIGDSITEGGDGTGGFRRPLFEKLTASGACPTSSARATCGKATRSISSSTTRTVSAYRIEQITPARASGMRRRSRPGSRPGTRRSSPSTPAPTTRSRTISATKGVIDRLDDMVSRIVAFNPKIHIFLAQIIPANAPANERRRPTSAG